MVPITLRLGASCLVAVLTPTGPASAQIHLSELGERARVRVGWQAGEGRLETVEGRYLSASDSTLEILRPGDEVVSLPRARILALETCVECSPGAKVLGGVLGAGAGFFGTILVFNESDSDISLGAGMLTALGMAGLGAAAGVRLAAGTDQWVPVVLADASGQRPSEPTLRFVLAPGRSGLAIGLRWTW